MRLLLLIRGLAGFASTVALYLSLRHLDLSSTTTITFVGPLFVGGLSACLLGEPFGQRERIAGVVSLAGVVLIARPSFLFPNSSGDGVPAGDAPPLEGPYYHQHGALATMLAAAGGGETGAGGGGGGGERLWGVLFALASVASTSVSWVSLRCVGNRASTYHSISYFALCSWLASFALLLTGFGGGGGGGSGSGGSSAGAPGDFVWPSSWRAGLLLTAVGLFSLLAQVFQTLGLQRETAARAATATYSQILFATLWQTTVLHGAVQALSLVGSGLIVLCGLWVAAAGGSAGAGH